ncbi:ABC transporter substrate-binding protein [Accumulibacter sp.]|uniref:ABC transporter substrate-binding protein n=1 Tax=Accumulibacter sp. TaxID=2053492 RepID=UPI0025884F26|nr:ABC transporter substrate-binding protein [Accumulibacter sp.]
MAENKVDVIIGSTITPNSLAMIDVVAEAGTPMIAMAASARIIEPMDAKRYWVFKTPQNDAQMATAIVEHMTNNNVRTVAYIGFADAYGEGWWNEFSKIAEVRRFRSWPTNDSIVPTSVTGQVLKILATKADAVLIGGAGTPAALPQKSLKEKGSRGSCTRRTGWPMPISCGSVPRTAKAPSCRPARCWLPRSCPMPTRSRKRRLNTSASTRQPMARGSVSTFGAHAWDASKLLANAVPEALKKAQPGYAGVPPGAA